MKKLLLTLAFGALVATSSFADDIYIIGSNVNGKSWSLAQADCKFTQTGTNTYEWTGSVLGTGFKFNNGTWSNDNINYGSNGKACEVGQPYTCTKGGSSANIALKDISEVQNPHIIMTWDGNNPPTFTIQGEEGGEITWYLAGINGNFVAADDYGAIPLYPTEEGGKQLESYEFEITVPTGEFKIASTGWGTEYGLYDNPPAITTDNLSATLIEVAGEAGNIPYDLPMGTYTCSFNLETLVVTFTQVSEGEIDFSEWYVNIVGPYNEWTDNGVHPDESGVSTTTGLKIGTDGFKVKVYNGVTDVYYIANTETPIATNTWVKLFVDTSDGPRVYINGADAEKIYDVQFNLNTSEVMVKEQDAVSSIISDNENVAPVYYNLQGIRVTNPTEGAMYIVRTGDKVTKVVK